MVPGEGIMRRPDESSARSGSGGGTQGRLCHAVTRDAGRGGRVPNWLWKNQTFMSCIKASPVQVVFSKKKKKETSWTSTTTNTHTPPITKGQSTKMKIAKRTTDGRGAAWNSVLDTESDACSRDLQTGLAHYCIDASHFLLCAKMTEQWRSEDKSNLLIIFMEPLVM